MKYIPMIMAALIGAAVSAPAQDVRSGRLSGRYAAARTAPSQAYRQGQSVGRRASRVVSPSLRRAATLRAPFGRGRWVTRCEQVLVPGYWARQPVPAVYGWVYGACGGRHWGVVTQAGSRQVWVPARYETHRRRVWVRC